jgi:hypothetical protein
MVVILLGRSTAFFVMAITRAGAATLAIQGKVSSNLHSDVVKQFFRFESKRRMRLASFHSL